MNDIKITKENGITFFDYKGIEVDRVTWESVPCPMYCDKITDEECCEIAKTLYLTLVDVFGIVAVGKYINKMVHGVDFDDFDDIDDFRWREEEKLFLEYGAIYYEDMSDEEYNTLMLELDRTTPFETDCRC
jgi:hypothetical protein